MGLYPSQTALVIRCCVQEREQTNDLFADTSDEGEPKKEEPSYARAVEPLPRSISTRTMLPVDVRSST